MKKHYYQLFYFCVFVCLTTYIFCVLILYLSIKFPYSPSIIKNYGEYFKIVHIEVSLYTFTEHYHLTLITGVCVILHLISSLIVIIYPIILGLQNLYKLTVNAIKKKKDP